ncbi:hypothetical protein OHA70_32980 [Kribbella sp. NBC_00382]|uniref:hypothetical protein n=1 Tax=Kribbella sp. NBC_00382 TaxID=2975967 RepID=UPI002E21CC37
MDLVELAEVVEANLMFRITGLEPSVLEGLGITGRRFGRGVAISVREDPSQFWSKAQGFGRDDVPVSSELIGEVVEFYREAGTPAANFHLPPDVLPGDWDGIRAEYGLEAGGTIVKLVRDDAPMVDVESSLRIGAVDPSDSESVRAWVETQMIALRVQDALKAGCTWVATETGKPAEGEQNPSLDNLRRAGFKDLYDRQFWIWRP